MNLGAQLVKKISDNNMHSTRVDVVAWETLTFVGISRKNDSKKLEKCRLELKVV